VRKPRRSDPEVEIDYATGAFKLTWDKTPAKGTPITATYEALAWAPSIIDRIASIENAELAKRIAKWDEDNSFKFVVFDVVPDPAVPNAYPELPR